MYDKLVIKFKVIDTKILNTSGLVSKSQCNLDKKTLRRRLKCWHKMPNARGAEDWLQQKNHRDWKRNLIVFWLVATAALSGTVTEIENKIPGITNLDILDHGTT